MIGLSISLCVADIVRNNLYVKDVEKIIAGTAIETQEHLDSVVALYRRCDWYDLDQDRCEAVMRQLFTEGKVEQPRITSGDRTRFPAVRWGSKKGVIWVDDESEIVWNEETSLL